MRFLCLIIACSFLSIGTANAQTPIPQRKPLISSQQDINTADASVQTSISKPPVKPKAPGEQKSFSDILENAISSVTETVSGNGIIMPPPVPDWKKGPDLQPMDDTPVQMVDGLPIPGTKPFRVIAAAPARTLNEQYAAKQSSDDSVIIRYHSNDDTDRTAGLRPSAPRMNEAERIYAENIGHLRETDAASPFQSDILPTAGGKSTSDPVILFFQEKSPKMEVGQMNILKNDVLRPLKQSTSSKVTILGFSEKNAAGADETRRLSLSRAMLIREYLMDNRIDANRIDVRAMADNTEIEPKDRVDITFTR